MLSTVLGGDGQACFSLQGTDGLFEMEHLPESNSQVQYTHTGDRATHPTGGDDRLQTVDAGLARGVKQKVVIAPIAQAKKPLWNPGQEHQNQPDLQAKDDVKNDAELS